MNSIIDFQKMKKASQPISMVTCYDAWSAKILNTSDVDCILVGDSVAMVVHGEDSTINATSEMMATHVRAVRKGAPDKFIIGDMPFLSVRCGIEKAMSSVDQIMKAGANCVKIEEVDGHEEIIRHIIESGVPVMGHLGLTPQSVHQLGGYKVQGRDEQVSKEIFRKSKKLQELGAFALVLECIPLELGTIITKELKIPTIGIGAGVHTDGQVLVLQDLLGMNSQFKPHFLKTYLDGHTAFLESINLYNSEVKKRHFPTEKESYR